MNHRPIFIVCTLLLIVIMVGAIGVNSVSAAMTPNQAELIFSTQSGDATGTQSVSFTYSGAGTVSVTSLTLTGNRPDLFDIIDPPSLPTNLQNGQSITIDVRFDPDDDDIGPFNAILNVISTDAYFTCANWLIWLEPELL